jgi:hypothetical protein
MAQSITLGRAASLGVPALLFFDLG